MLTELGANVVLTRDADVSLVNPSAGGNRKQRDMALREALIVDSGAHILLSIHMNAYTSGDVSGAEVYFAEDSADGEALGNALQASFHAANARHKKNARAGDYYILSCCEAAVLIECGYLSNPREEALLNTPEYRGQVAEMIAQGVVTYWSPM
jgi:N-acetylmuramoyl-L-alanine amidase